MIRRAKRQCRQDSRCEVVAGDAEHLPFRANAFELLLAITVILEPQCVPKTLREAKRVISRRGSAALTSLVRAEHFSRTQFLIEQGFQGWKVRKTRVGRDLGFFAERGTFGQD